MNLIDEIYTQYPYYGSPKITAELRKRGYIVNHKRIERLMRLMSLTAIYPKPDTSQPREDHPKYPYLLENMEITTPNQVWGTDITYIRAQGTWYYLVAILDWFSRYVVSWILSDHLESNFCVANLKKALSLARPQIHNSDQGSQFTSNDYIQTLQTHPKIQISMDGKNRCFDNIFTERLWRTVKYEEVYLKDYNSFSQANQSLTEYLNTYNHERLHQSLNYQTPAEVYFQKTNLNI